MGKFTHKLAREFSVKTDEIPMLLRFWILWNFWSSCLIYLNRLLS